MSTSKAEIARLSLIYDAHTHLHLDREERGEYAAKSILAKLGGAALMSTGDDDWGSVMAICAASPRTRCLFGVHPWFAHRVHADPLWLERLRETLISVPGSAVGEIGLDRQWRTPDTGEVEYKAQFNVFQRQLSLAAELRLPVSLHCVRAQGDLYRALTEAPELPPTIYLHAFGGARGTVEQLVRSRRFGDRLYFGFAACINLRASKTLDVIAAVPEQRLVVESDRSSAARADIGAELSEMLQIYAEINSWGSADEAARRTAENARRLYAPADVADVTLGRHSASEATPTSEERSLC